ncbi:MAG: rubredoxin [Clostridia bacterium]|nr:rubredoxin [Clostridia bacterium]
MRKYKCSICGYVYDESVGAPSKGIAPGTKWEDIPDSFVCPVCGAPKSVFEPDEETLVAPAPSPANTNDEYIKDLKELSPGEISAICSSLAKGCEKQRLTAEMDAFNQLSDYFKTKAATEKGKTLDDAARILEDDMANGFVSANAVAKAHTDRGALRSLVWSEKVSMMLKSLLERFRREGDAMLENTRIWVCDICGFIYIGDALPEICPVCKVPSFKIIEVERR